MIRRVGLDPRSRRVRDVQCAISLPRPLGPYVYFESNIKLPVRSKIVKLFAMCTLYLEWLSHFIGIPVDTVHGKFDVNIATAIFIKP